ncbi:hypothetical protein [Natronolimnohabitans innermongolicus]|uniref:Uncharacterized protein n=1 Tax=Natronolimnohabitans innermongolicus JCM 12255 TaxID=1227499 RepID=L9WEF3_9EURY|nr:hypothetical protein [Natronolimnohabitans innermongolicus]ELY47732.1 hypothetical protein C493_22266 [Natronolimnohabitans innermongolicus JCM 12255]
MSDRDNAWRILDRGADDAEDMTWGDFVTARLMAILTSVALVIISFFDRLGEALMAPISAFAEGLSEVVGSTFLESIQIIAAGARNAAYALEYGATAELGVATYPIAIATVISGIYVMIWAWTRTEWNPIAFLYRRFR